MKQLADDPQYKSQLNGMRELYYQQLQDWKTEGVKYNGYGRYGVLFDRSIPWKEKEKVLAESKGK